MRIEIQVISPKWCISK